MKSLYFFTLFTSLILMSCSSTVPNYASFEEYPVYDGTDLGLTLSYPEKHAVFKIWSPAAEEMELRLYEKGLGGEALEVLPMQRKEQGVWERREERDLLGKYYTFRVKYQGQWREEVPDPYARAVGTNGLRAMVVDLSKTHPEGWLMDEKAAYLHKTDAILYELHVRDLSMHPQAGIQAKGKFLGLCETGTRSAEDLPTGLDHILELGVTHVHLLPSYDYYTVDESQPELAQFNWGYDPQNYNVPEGSYATDPEDGVVRIREFKQMVKTLHDKGLRVVMDVVYNHTGRSEDSSFEQLVPGYFYRHNADGSFSNASGCGNEVASERPMVRKFIIESLQYWMQEYHIDGFRFDLMGIHDQETMNQISDSLHAIDPSVLLYGEGWMAGDSPLEESKRSLKKYTHQLNRIAAFSDDIRDGLKGSVFSHEDRGFASGKPGMEATVRFGIVGATAHPQVDYAKVNYSDAPWADEPYQCINYVSCHDNHTLYDRLINSVKDASEQERIQMHKLANAIVLTSQGIPFLHAGVEFLRTKGGDENSYKSPDRVNQLDWPRKKQYEEVFDYYRGLIQLRKGHPVFRMPSKALIQEHLRFLELPSGVVGYQLAGRAVGDAWEEVLVLLNGRRVPQAVEIPEGYWTVVVNERAVNEEGLGRISGGRMTLPATAAWVLVKSGSRD
ncbi:MAG: type I pullulanase [Bacteroidota bacterium]